MMEIGFRQSHPYVIFSYYLYTGFLVMYFKHPLFLFIALILLVLVNISHDKGKALKKWTIPLVTMGLLFIILNPFLVSQGTNILFYFRGKQVTLEATIYGVVMALAIVGIIVMFVSFNLILNGNKFLFIFSKVLPRTTFLVMLSLRFIPLLKDRFIEINDVQRVRGMNVSEGNIKLRTRNGMYMIQTLLTWSLEEAIQTADSMKARGYGSGKKTTYLLYKMKRQDWLSLFILLFLFVICLVGGLLGYGKIIIYPQLGTLHLYILDWVVLVCMMLLLSFPLIIEGREMLRWKY